MTEETPKPLHTYEETKATAQERLSGYSVMQRRCLHCANYPFYYPGDKALDPGHIYSKAGVREFGVSGMCEYCFDQVTGGIQDDVKELLGKFDEPEAPLGPLGEQSFLDHKAMTGTNEAVDHSSEEGH